MHRLSALTLTLALALVAGAAAFGAATASARPADTRLSLVAYSTPREAYGKLIPAFQATAAGKNTDFSQCYGSPGEQSRAVKAGLKADIVALSLAPDIDELVKAGIVDARWNRQSYRGMVTNSVVVFVVRDGNPKKIFGWNDFLKPGVHPITSRSHTTPRTEVSKRWWSASRSSASQRRSSSSPGTAAR